MYISIEMTSTPERRTNGVLGACRPQYTLSCLEGAEGMYSVRCHKSTQNDGPNEAIDNRSPVAMSVLHSLYLP